MMVLRKPSLVSRCSHFFTLTLLLTLTHSKVHAQSRMNPFGHFSDNRTRPSALSRTSDPALDTLNLAGESIFRSANGYISLDALYENAPVQMRIYSKEGELRYQKEYRQMMNMKFSPNGRYIAFHDMEKIQVFNTVCLTSKTVEGGNVFAVDNGFNVASYDETTESVQWMDQRLPAPEQIYKVLIREGQPLFVGYSNVWQIGPNGLQVVFTANEGRIFDAMVDSLNLHVSTKVEEPCQFIFAEYSSQDLQQFKAGTITTYPLAHCQHELPSTASERITTSELIRDPLHFYDNSYAQPIGNTYNEIQEYALNSPYPHPGVDLLGNYQESVYSVKPGIVKAILTTSAQYHWRIAIANNNTAARSQGYLYAHIEELTLPYAVGDYVDMGDVVGYLVEWPIVGFTHCHFARISDQGQTWVGNWWTLDNPLKFMTNIITNTPGAAFEPAVPNQTFAFRNSSFSYMNPNALSGGVRVIAKIFSRTNSLMHVGVDRIRYSLSPLANPALMLIDTQSIEFKHWNDNYFGGSYSQAIINTLYSRDATCFSQGNYDFRDFYYIVTSSNFDDTITFADNGQYLMTNNYPNGQYIFRVQAFDPFGNQAIDSMIVTFANPVVSAEDATEAEELSVYPNPSGSGIFHVRSEKPLRYEVFNALGQKLHQGNVSNGETDIDLSSATAGTYWFRATNGKTKITRQLVVQTQ